MTASPLGFITTISAGPGTEAGICTIMVVAETSVSTLAGLFAVFTVVQDTKFVPVKVVCWPLWTEPTFGETEVNVGGGPAAATVKFTPFETNQPTVTVTGPVVAPLGTCVVSVVAVAESVVAVTSLNLI